MIALDSVFGLATAVLNKIFPDPVERQKASTELLRLQQEGQLAELQADVNLSLAQTEVNKVEAGSSDKFTSRWRPFIGWVCGFAFAFEFIGSPLLNWFILMFSSNPVLLPTFSAAELTPVLTGLLGLGTLRTFEKYKGVA